jgi:hypothetical protein
MIDAQKYQSMANATWPLFERKLRRARLLKKIKRYVPWLGTILIASTMLLFYEAPVQLQKVPSELPIFKDLESNKDVQQLDFQKALLKHDGMFYPAENKFSMHFNYEAPLEIKRIDLDLPRGVLVGKRADLILACAQLNIQPLTWSLQSNGYSLSALIDQQTLMIMNLMYGTESLPEYPTDFNNESFYRPMFFPADQFVHIAFYEVGEWIQDPLTVRLNMNRINDNVRIAPWLVSSNSVRNIDGTYTMINAFDRVSPGVFLYRGLNPSFDRSSMQQQYRKNLFVADRPPTAFNPLLFHQADTLIAITAQAQRLTKLSMYGVLYDSKEIQFKSKGIHSLKRLEPMLDPVNNTLYVLAPTNFHFVIYQVDLNSGLAQQVFQTPSVWRGAEFEISAGQLTYNYKGKLITVSLP